METVSICRIVGYGEFTKWLKSAEWKYSARAVNRFITIYERSLELAIQIEWFSILSMISPSELFEILPPFEALLQLAVLRYLQRFGSWITRMTNNVESIYPFINR